jgi:hypothetical protein
MELEAKIIQILPIVTGQSKNGEWQKQDVVFQTLDSQYPKTIAISFWGDKINADKLKVGNVLNVSIEIDSREHNGKWYTNVKGWKYEVVTVGGAGVTTTPKQQTTITTTDTGPVDDLPF